MKDFFPVYSIGDFINQPTLRTEFEITRFEEMAEPEIDNIHKHTFYEILWVDEGESRQTIDFQSYELKPKSLFFISPGQVHEFEAWQNLKGGTIMFTEEFFLQNQQNKDKLFELVFLDNVYFNPGVLLQCQDYALFRNYIDLLVNEKNSASSNNEILQLLLNILLLQVRRSIESSQSTISSKRNIILFKQFKSLLETAFRDAVTANDYAYKLNITRHHLNRIVKEITGKTVTEVIRGRSILEAKRMLLYTDLSVSEIALNHTYFDSSYFSKIFKSAVGYAPSEFKSLMFQKYRRR